MASLQPSSGNREQGIGPWGSSFGSAGIAPFERVFDLGRGLRLMELVNLTRLGRVGEPIWENLCGL